MPITNHKLYEFSFFGEMFDYGKQEMDFVLL